MPRLAEVTRISESQIYRYISGENELKAAGLVAIAQAGGASITWLANNEGPMLLRDSAPSAPQERADYVYIPVYDVRAAAGHGALAEDREAFEHCAFSRVWLSKNVGVAPSRLKMITVAGDSMEPDLHDGDVVMIDISDVEVLREGVYVFALGDHIYVKRLALQGDTLMMISRNSERFPPREIKALRENSTFRLIGRVVGQPTFKRF